MIDISVIVPVYKVELYIEKCIYSLLSQSFNNFEIILIDDCTPDRSIVLAKEILENQSRVPYQIISKVKNEGLSAARNTGVKNSNGKYLLFFDSDDWIEKETLKKLFETTASTKAGIVVFRIRQVYNDDITESKVIKSLPRGLLTGKQALIRLFIGDFGARICNILFSKSLFDSTKFPTGVLYEDMLTLPYLLIKEEKVCFIEDIFYNYLQRPGSITRSYDPDIVKVCDRLHRMEIDLKPLLDETQKQLLIMYVYMSYLTISHHAATLSPDYESAKELLLACRKNIKIAELLKILKARPVRSMFQFFLLKFTPHNFFKKYSSRFHQFNNTLQTVEGTPQS